MFFFNHLRFDSPQKQEKPTDQYQWHQMYIELEWNKIIFVKTQKFINVHQLFPGKIMKKLNKTMSQCQRKQQQQILDPPPDSNLHRSSVVSSLTLPGGLIWIHKVIIVQTDMTSLAELIMRFLFTAVWTLLPLFPPLQASVKPMCGRMVGFSSGGENPHGVKAITSGQRCAVALWFTLDPLFRELVSTCCSLAAVLSLNNNHPHF